MNSFKHLSGLTVIFFIGTMTSFSQSLDNPGEYITAVNKARGDMDNKYMQYLSTAAHSRRARKIEKQREQVLDNITQSRYKTIDLPKYKGDNSLRQGSIDYIQICYQVFNEDYKKIVNMEELAEQSVDEMQAYLLLQEKVDDKLHEAYNNLDKITKDFAAKYNVTLIEDNSVLNEKMSKAGKLNAYMNDVYIHFFKCNWEDGQMVTAMNNKKVNDIEQARSALLRYANEGLAALDTTKPFESDPSLVIACRQALQYYKNSAEKDVPQMTDYFLKEEEFAKTKKAFEAKSNRSKDDVDTYNKAVKDINNAANAYNQLNSKSNNSRTQVVNNWNDADRKFANEHMPYYH
ncbi:MAG TPA: hypothetical protein VMH01_06480 [Puia sp.]|nr:hypothetical protein [Puia sp.]